MNIITQNPFRVLGLTGNATEKELQKQLSKIKAYTRVGKEINLDYDLDFLGKLDRNSEIIQDASSKIEQADKKLMYSLFWFVKNTKFDDIALNYLKDNQIEKAIEIWEKTLKDEITSKNCSSYQNISTLYIALSLTNGQVNLERLEKGISTKGVLLKSDNLNDFSNLVTGNNLTNNSNDIIKKFVDEVLDLLKPYLDQRYGISTNELISLFNTFPANIKKYVSAKFTEAPISSIENRITETIEKRKKHPRNAYTYGEALYNNTYNDLQFLRKLLGQNNIQLKMVINKLANEIMQCAIEYYNYHLEGNSGIDPGNNALKIAKRAKSLGPDGQVLVRIKENTEPIQQWVDEKPQRERQKLINADITFITNEIEHFQSLTNTIDNARNLINACKYKLINIKNILGSYDKFYLEISSIVVANSLGMIIEVINKEQRGILDSPFKFRTLLQKVTSAISVLNTMKNMDMDSTTRSRLNTNYSTIENIRSQLKNQLDAYDRQQKSYRTSSGYNDSGSSSGSCYIATMAYGDYNHPQVMTLRKFRDETLSNTLLGRIFIKFYYATSPHLVKLLKNQKYINKLIRNLLDKFVNKIK